MKRIHVGLQNNAYNIVVGVDILSRVGSMFEKLKMGTDAIIVTNPIVKKHYGTAIIKSLEGEGMTIKFLVVPDGESSKSPKVAFDLMEKIAKYDVFKKIFIVALGGGVVGDLAGYVAATYKRGVPFAQIPTTLLAQVDSSIGGKVGIDLPIGKNLVGAFYQPKIVVSDVSVLKTLPQRQLRNGLAEVVKYGIIYDAKFFTYIEKNIKDIMSCDEKCLKKIVQVSSEIKAEVVVADERETKNIRTILNFGHTVGHAVEAAGKYELYQHGEAIALGTRIAVDMSMQLGKLTKQGAEKINALLTDIKLPEKVTQLKMKDILNVMKHDKKFVAGTNRFVLATKIGHVDVIDNISEDIIKKAIQKYLK